MKRIIILLSIIALMLCCLSSCTKPDQDETDIHYYNDAQEHVFSIMHGTFKYEFYGIVTIISFGQHYTKPQEANYAKYGSTRELHGEITITYYNGDSYKRYYHLSSDTKTLTMYNDNQNITIAYVKDFQYVDPNTFKLKEVKDVLWDTYKRTN